MKLNIIGLVSAILAFIAIVLPWYSDSINGYSLIYFIDISSRAGFPGTAVLILISLVLMIIGGVLGLLGSFVIGKRGKILLMVAIILVVLSPICFAIRIVDIGLPLFGSYMGYSLYVSFGFFLAFVAAFLMSFSARKHPMEVGAVPFAPAPPPPPPPS